MINWFNMPSEGLSNGGQFEIKELTATENKVYETSGEVYSKVTVNVEGGGGSSDFTTAEVTFICNDQTLIDSPVDFYGAFYGVDDMLETPIEETMPYIGFYGSETVKQIILYKGCATMTLGDSVDEINSISGSVEAVGRASYKISGNCTIHYTPVGEA